MRIHLACGFLCLLIGNTYAATIYKWIDETGNVHYDDNDSHAKNSKQITIDQPPPNKSGANEIGRIAAPAVKKSLPGSETGNTQKCLSLARSMVDKKTSTPDEIRADSKQLLDLCPGIAYECVTYLERPEGNRCKAVPMLANGHITSNNTFRR